MQSEPERAAAPGQATPSETDVKMLIFVGGFMISRMTKKERREFLSGCDVMVARLEASMKLVRPAQAAVRDAWTTRTACDWYRRERRELEDLI